MSKSIAREKALLCDHLSRRLGRPARAERTRRGQVPIWIFGGENFSFSCHYFISVDDLRRFGQMSELAQIRHSHAMAAHIGRFGDKAEFENMMRNH